MTRTDPRTENKTARELMRENVQHALRDFFATYGEKESEIMSAFDTALEAIAVEVENQTPDEFSGYGEIERRIVKGTLEGATNIIRRHKSV